MFLMSFDQHFNLEEEVISLVGDEQVDAPGRSRSGVHDKQDQ